MHDPTITDLQTLASDLAEHLGHGLGGWTTHGSRTTAECHQCHRRVVCCTDPTAAGLAVAGGAVTVTCARQGQPVGCWLVNPQGVTA